MESCEIGDLVIGGGPLTEDCVVVCNGPCRQSVPALCAVTSGLILTCDAEHQYWFCDHCQLNLCTMSAKRSSSPESAGSRQVVKRFDDHLDLSVLPAEMWTAVFLDLSPCHLLQVRLTCRLWKNIVDSCGTLLAKLTVTFPKKLIIEPDYIPVHLPSVPKAHFESCKINSMGSWWPQFAQGLTEVVFSSCKVALPDLLGMLRNTPNIKCLEVSDYDETKESPTAADFRLDKVEKLELDGRNITQLSEVFLDVCRNLKSLKITWNFYGNHDDHVQPLKMAKFVNDLRNTLTELYINCSDEIMAELLKLDGLKLKKAAFLFEPVLYKLLVQFYEKYPALEYLDIHSCVDFGFIDEKDRNEMIRLLPELKHLSINVGPYFCVNLAFLAKYTKLQSIALYGYQEENISAYELELPDGGLPNLRELYFEGIYFPGKRLQQFLAKTPNVHTLLIECECLFDCWSDFLAAIGTLKLLRKLSINFIDIKKPSRCPFNCLPTVNFLNANLGGMSPSLANIVLDICPKLRDFHANLRSTDSSINDEVLRVICREISKKTLKHD